MGIKYLLMAILVLLASCETALQATPTTEYQPTEITQTTNPCDKITCKTGQTCNNGTCECAPNTKQCGNTCIAQTQCCTNNDCETKYCNKGTCEQPKECKYGEQNKNGDCTCTTGKTYCKEQDKCIEQDDCCYHGQCARDERCKPTLWTTSLCFTNEDKKICRLLSDNNRTETITIKNQTYKAQATNWHTDESITFQINNQTLKMTQNQKITLQNTTIYQEGLNPTGGNCEEDED